MHFILTCDYMKKAFNCSDQLVKTIGKYEDDNLLLDVNKTKLTVDFKNTNVSTRVELS